MLHHMFRRSHKCSEPAAVHRLTMAVSSKGKKLCRRYEEEEEEEEEEADEEEEAT